MKRRLEAAAVALAFGIASHASGLQDGLYRMGGEATELCPQRVHTETSGDRLTAVSLTFLFPCSQRTVKLSCESGRCIGEGAEVTVIGPDHYDYRGTRGSAARFARK